MKRPARVPLQLSESLHKRLSAYALAASAAGVGVLALAQPTEARIVYTPKHVDCSRGCPINLTNVGQRQDFRVSFASSNVGSTQCTYGGSLFVDAPYFRNPPKSNAVVGVALRSLGTNSRHFAFALHAGVRVG